MTIDPEDRPADRWSDNEERLYQQRRRRILVLRVLFLAFAGLVAAAVIVGGGASYALIAAAIAALAATALTGARWQLNGNVADSFGPAARGRRADRKHQRARREQAIRNGTWRPPGAVR
ncbi:MAG TPA: hypothetical protein VH637_03230 [Streptosporangiaceae bacterium]